MVNHRRFRTPVLVAALVAVGSAGTFGYLLKGPKWFTRQVPYYVNPANMDLSPSLADAAVRVGADAWGLQSTASVAMVYAGTTTGTTVTNNGKNEVFFRNASNGSAIATTYSYYSGSQIVDTDIVFWDQAFKFFSGTSGCSSGLYIEDIATHEFGHALGLGHSDVSGATMAASVSYCSQSPRSLAADDVAGIEAIYPPSATRPPAAPSGLSVVAAATSPSSALALTWADQSSDEDRFRVERSADGTNWGFVVDVSANTTSYTNTNLPAGVTYAYRVRAENTAGPSSYSNAASGTTQTAPPSAPASPLPGNGTTNASLDSDLKWTAGGATTYDVYFGTSSTPTLYASGVTSSSLVLPRLARTTTYYWRVVAKNAYGSTTGPVWSFTTKRK